MIFRSAPACLTPPASGRGRQDGLREARSPAARLAARRPGETEAATHSNTHAFRLAYWTAFRDATPAALRERLHPARPARCMALWVGRDGFHAAVALEPMGQGVGVELMLTRDGEGAGFAALLAERAEIEAAYGAALDWTRAPDRPRRARIGERLAAAPSDPADWPRQHRWLADRLIRLEGALRPRLAALPRDDAPVEASEHAPHPQGHAE